MRLLPDREPASDAAGDQRPWAVAGVGLLIVGAVGGFLDDDDCSPVIGTWQPDELMTMHVGLEGPADNVVLFYDQRTPLVDRDPAVYQVTRVDPRPSAAPFTLTDTCVADRPSPLDGTVLGCPCPRREVSAADEFGRVSRWSHRRLRSLRQTS